MACAPSNELLRQWTSTTLTRTGVQVMLRPLCPHDREREIAFINSLSERSRYFRLFTPLRSLSRHLIDQLMDLDFDQRMAFVATVQRDKGEEIIGIARYCATHEAGTAELGITVTDAWQRRGVARLLLEQLMWFAQQHGIRRLIGMVLAENLPMISFARALGFAVHFNSTSHLFEISRNLNDIQPGSPASPRPGANACLVRESPG